MKSEPMGVIILYLDEHADTSWKQLLASLKRPKKDPEKVTEDSLKTTIAVR